MLPQSDFHDDYDPLHQNSSKASSPDGFAGAELQVLQDFLDKAHVTGTHSSRKLCVESIGDPARLKSI